MENDRLQKVLKVIMAVAGLTMVILLFVLFLQRCYVDDPKPEPPSPPAPLTQYPPPVTPPTDLQKWDLVKDLKMLKGYWEVRKDNPGTGTKMLILQREPNSDFGKAYRGVYPWQLTYEPQSTTKAPLRCGFYPELQTDGGDWRLAYCAGYERDAGAGAYAQRLMFHVLHSDADILKMRVGNTLELIFDRAQEME